MLIYIHNLICSFLERQVLEKASLRRRLFAPLHSFVLLISLKWFLLIRKIWISYFLKV